MRLEEYKHGVKIYRTSLNSERLVGALVVYQNKVIIGGRLKSKEILYVLQRYDDIVSIYDTDSLNNIHVRYFLSEHSFYINTVAGNKEKLIKYFKRISII